MHRLRCPQFEFDSCYCIHAVSSKNYAFFQDDFFKLLTPVKNLEFLGTFFSFPNTNQDQPFNFQDKPQSSMCRHLYKLERSDFKKELWTTPWIHWQRSISTAGEMGRHSSGKMVLAQHKIYHEEWKSLITLKWKGKEQLTILRDLYCSLTDKF